MALTDYPPSRIRKISNFLFLGTESKTRLVFVKLTLYFICMAIPFGIWNPRQNINKTDMEHRVEVAAGAIVVIILLYIARVIDKKIKRIKGKES